MDGLILVDKPKDLTSHRVVIEIRKLFSKSKVGHYGTLDPLATGLVVVAVGKATRLFSFFSKVDKEYQGRMRLGFSTNTYDSTGEPTSEECLEYPSRTRLLDAMRKFQEEIEQFPPPFSAKKYKGKPLYTLARQNKEFELRSSKVIVYDFKLTSYAPPFFDFEVRCSSGTYIRSLAHDLGQALNCGAHLTQLNRTSVGNFKLEDGFLLEEIKKYAEQGEIDRFLIPMEVLLPEFPKIVLKERGASLARNGNFIFPENILKILDQDDAYLSPSERTKATFRLFSVEGKLLALGKTDPERRGIHPFLVIDS